MINSHLISIPTPIFKRTNLLRKLNENIHNEYFDLLLNESLGSFKNQKEISNKIANVVISKIENDFSSKIVEIDTSEFEQDIKSVVCQIKIINDVTYASLDNLTSKGALYITLYIQKFNTLIGNINQLKNKICEVISHELMHGYIFLKRFSNNEDINDMPDYYETALKMYDKYGAQHIFGAFAYALYNTYYQERQAFISQTQYYIKGRLEQKEKWANEEIKSIVRDSAAYQAYSNNLNVVQQLKQYPIWKSKLQTELTKYNIIFSDKELDKKIEWIEKVSKDTINKVCKNIMLELK